MMKSKILLVNATEELFEIINPMFATKCDIYSVSKNDTVIEILSSNDKPNLILLDTSENYQSGYDLAKKIKNDARTSETPIVFILDDNNKNSINECFLLGASDCIVKPFYHSEFEAKIKNILQVSKLRDSLSNALEDRQRHILTIERQLNAIDEHVLYISLDLDKNIINVSTALMRLLSCKKQDFIKANEHCISKKEMGEKKFKKIFDELEIIDSYELETVTTSAEKKEIWLKVKIAKDIDYFDKHIGYVATIHDITDKKIIEEKNIELDKVNYLLDDNLNYLKQFKKAVEEASIFSITDAKGTIVEINKNFETISGYSEKELLGKPHNIVRHEDMPKEVFKEMWKTIQSGNIWKGIVKNRRKNSDAYYVMSEIVPVYNTDGTFREYISIRSDITELEEYRQLLKHELDTKNRSLEEKLNYIAQYEEAINNYIAILKTSSENIIQYVNDNFCKLSGYTPEELIGRNCAEIRDEKHRKNDDCKKIGEELKKNRSVSKIMTNIKKSGEKYFSSTLFTPILDVNGNFVEGLQVMYDLTEIINLNEEITNTQKEVVFTMGAIGENRSQETGYHVKRVAEYSYLLAILYGVDKERAELLRLASPMHDIGKVAIPDSILNKPGKLTAEEFEIMKTHAALGNEMLKYSDRPILKASAEVANTHHEKYDGSGYPNGLKGDNIPIFGRITAIADVFDALGNDRIYKKAWKLDAILDLFNKETGKHFDPVLVELFFDNLNQFLEIRDMYS